MYIHSNVHLIIRTFKVTKMKKQNHNPEVPLFPLLMNTTSLPHLFVFFSLSLSLSSPRVVSLIGQQTACKCSNPEKSPGALVIGCALQHSSQSIKARWAPVNSFSLLLLWLWYCHIDSNFALNPSNTASLFHFVSFTLFLYTFPFIFKAPESLTLLPQNPSLKRHFLTTLTLGLCYFLFSFFLVILLWSILEPLLPHSPCAIILNFSHFSVLRENEQKTERNMD